MQSEAWIANFRLLRNALREFTISLEKLLFVIEDWECDGFHCAGKTGDQLSDDLRRATLEGVCLE